MKRNEHCGMPLCHFTVVRKFYSRRIGRLICIFVQVRDDSRAYDDVDANMAIVFHHQLWVVRHDVSIICGLHGFVLTVPAFYSGPVVRCLGVDIQPAQTSRLERGYCRKVEGSAFCNIFF